MKQRPAVEDPNQLGFRDAWSHLSGRPMFAAMNFVARPDGTFAHVNANLVDSEPLRAARATAHVDADGGIVASKAVRLSPGE